MASVLDLLTQQLGGENLRKMSGRLGTDEGTTGNAVSAALPALLGALARNTSQSQGAESLAGALDRDHDGSVFDNLGGLMDDPRSGHGEGILGHVFGNRRSSVESGLSRASGMKQESMGQLMTMLAPMVLGALGKEKRRKNLDANGLAGFLDQEQREVERRAPQEMGIIGKLLDTDNDGDVDVGDLARHGAGLLGKLLK
jgi:hypothetical protein